MSRDLGGSTIHGRLLEPTFLTGPDNSQLHTRATLGTVRMLNGSDDQMATPRPLRVMNSDRRLSIASSTSCRTFLTKSTSSTAPVQSAQSALEALKQLSSSANAEDGAVPRRRFPIDGYDAADSGHPRPTDNGQERSTATIPKSRSRLGLLGSRLMRSSRRLASSRHSSNGSTAVDEYHRAVKMSAHRGELGSESSAMEKGSANPLRIRRPSSRIPYGQQAPIEAIGRGYGLEGNGGISHSHFMVPLVRMHDFTLPSSSVAGRVKRSTWLIMTVSCTPHTLGGLYPGNHIDHISSGAYVPMAAGDAGCLRNLDASFIMPDGYSCVTTLGSMSQARLVGSETWTVIMRFDRLANTARTTYSRIFTRSRPATLQSRPASYALMDEVQQMLNGRDQQRQEQAFQVNLSYQHSLLPDRVHLTQKERCRIGDSRDTAGDHERRLNGAGSLLTQQHCQTEQKPVPANPYVPHESAYNKWLEMAECIIAFLDESLRSSSGQADAWTLPSPVHAQGVLDLLADFEGVAGGTIGPAMIMELRQLKRVFQQAVGVVRVGNIQSACPATAKSTLQHKMSKLRLSPTKKYCSGKSPSRSVIDVQESATENRRNALEIDRDLEHLGPVLANLTNHRTRISTVAKRRLACWEDGSDDIVPPPLFSPRKRVAEERRTHGHGPLGNEGVPESRNENRVVREFAGQYDGKTWRQGQLQQSGNKIDIGEERDPARVIWETMRVSSGESSSLSDDDEERLREMNLTCAPWM